MLIDFVELIEKIVKNSSYIFSKRFIFFFIFVAIGVILYYFDAKLYLLYATVAVCIILFYHAIFLYPWELLYFKKLNGLIDSYQPEKAKKMLENKYYRFMLFSYVATIKYENSKLLYYITFSIGSAKEVFDSLRILSSKKLLEINGEKQSFDLWKVTIYRVYGNIKLLEETLSQINSEKLKPNQLLWYKVSESYLCEFNGDIDGAKNLLIPLLSKERLDQATLYNNLARLEEMQENYMESLRYYEKAYDAFLREPHKDFDNVICHNLILQNAKLGKKDEAVKWLHKYEETVDKKNYAQYLEFLNTQVLLARQLSDRILLLDGYSKMDIYIAPFLERKMWLAHFISKLRMSFNDGVDFGKNILGARNLFDEIVEQKFPENYFALKEIFYILKQLDEANQLNDLLGFYQKVATSVFSLKKDVLEYRKALPNLAVTEHFFWLTQENFLNKIKLAQAPNKENFTSFFNEIEQIKNYATTYDNIYYVVRANMMIVDEYLAYSKALNNTFRSDFFDLAKNVLNEAEDIFKNNLKNPMFHEYVIPIAFYHMKFNDKNKAKKYWDIFHNQQKQNILQYATWAKMFYIELKQMIEQEASH